ncbi:MAG: glycine cleavage system aminomethyltransferase GcvT, partial [Dongiaceae bacterium]
MVPFAGYDMPVQYPAGILTEHLHTRAAAGLFDVSHMGQIRLRGESFEQVAAALERLCPADFSGLAPGQQRYSFFTNNQAGILDDLMVTRAGNGDARDYILMVINASCKEQDLSHLESNLNNRCEVEPLHNRALLALQGPKAGVVMAKIAPESATMKFMTGRPLNVGGMQCFVTRSGYTGEDGFEISVPAGEADNLARKLLGDPEVKPIGLGARDSLRLEAGLCLYGHDIDTTTTPVEAGLVWSIGKDRRVQGGFPGDQVIIRQIAGGPPRRRVGLRPEGRTIAREGSEIVDTDSKVIGKVTSGGFGPSLNGPLAMGYV